VKVTKDGPVSAHHCYPCTLTLDCTPRPSFLHNIPFSSFRYDSHCLAHGCTAGGGARHFC
jgi:hypothetical protein